MLNRRHIRIKVLQTLYAYFQSDNSDMVKGEKELLHSMERIYDLYLYLLQLLISLKRHSGIHLEESKRSTFMKKENESLNSNFSNFKLIELLEENTSFQKICKERKVS